MATPTLRGARAFATVTMGIAWLTILLTACGGSPSAAPPSTAPATPRATVAGPTDFADWTVRQGFGGSSGLRNVAKVVHWISNHPGEETVWNVDDETTDIANLTSWLDTHPATACWAEIHAEVRASLASLTSGYAAARVEIQAGRWVPDDVTTAMVAAADNAMSLTPPSGCR
jgi:hypothetical protein